MSESPAAVRRRRRRRQGQVVLNDEAYAVKVRRLDTGALQVVWNCHRNADVALLQVRGLDEAVESVVVTLIARCRAEGLSWDDIATLMGFSRPAIVKRYGPAVAAAVAEVRDRARQRA